MVSESQQQKMEDSGCAQNQSLFKIGNIIKIGKCVVQ